MRFLVAVLKVLLLLGLIAFLCLVAIAVPVLGWPLLGATLIAILGLKALQLGWNGLRYRRIELTEKTALHGFVAQALGIVVLAVGAAMVFPLARIVFYFWGGDGG